jgi:hypothetical protein
VGRVGSFYGRKILLFGGSGGAEGGGMRNEEIYFGKL